MKCGDDHGWQIMKLANSWKLHWMIELLTSMKQPGVWWLRRSHTSLHQAAVAWCGAAGFLADPKDFETCSVRRKTHKPGLDIGVEAFPKKTIHWQISIDFLYYSYIVVSIYAHFAWHHLPFGSPYILVSNPNISSILRRSPSLSIRSKNGNITHLYGQVTLW